MDISNIEGIKIFCFGYKPSKDKNGWWYMANMSVSQTWHSVNVEEFQTSLNSDLKIGEKILVAAQFKDVGSDTVYTVQFNNVDKKWKIRIPNSKSLDEIPLEDKKTFFKSPIWKNTCKKAVEILNLRKEIMEEVIMQHLTKGELPEINELQYQKVLDFLNDVELMNNLRLSKYIK